MINFLVRISLLLIIFLSIGCASNPIEFKKDQVRVPKVLKPNSKILVLTYMSKKQTSFRVELLGTTQIYQAEITEVDALVDVMKNSFKENINFKLIPETVLATSSTYKALDIKNKENDDYHNLNKGMLIFKEEDMLHIPKIAQETKADAVILILLDYRINTMASYDLSLNALVQDNQGQMIFNDLGILTHNFENITDDPIEDNAEIAGKVISSFSLIFTHRKTKGLQPTFIENTKKVIDPFFQNFATTFKLEKKKK